MPGMRMTPTIRWLLIINIAAFLVQLIGDTFAGTHILEVFALIPSQVFEKHYYWQFFTYLFMHADLFHILFNMLIIWMIGVDLDLQWGSAYFLKYYFTCGVSAGALYIAVQLFFRGTVAAHIPLVGSSGAVYGLLVAYGIIFSERVLLFMMIFPMKAKYFVLLLGGIEFISTVFYSHSGVANVAHLGGMITGFAYLYISAFLRIYARNQKLPRSLRKRMPWGRSHLKLVVNNEIIREFENDDEDGGGPPTVH